MFRISPCPYCKGEAMLLVEYSEIRHQWDRVHAVCSVCGAHTDRYISDRKVLRDWEHWKIYPPVIDWDMNYCVHCGIGRPIVHYDDYGRYSIQCSFCGAITRPYSSIFTANHEWRTGKYAAA